MRASRHKTQKVWSIMLFLLVKNKHYVEIKAQIDFLHLTLYMHVSCEHLVFQWSSRDKTSFYLTARAMCLKNLQI